jgi:molecular chaperone GrpE
MENEEKIEEIVEVTVEQKLQESQDKYLLLYADFENYKRRVQKDKEELVLNTKTKMLSSILDMDNDISIALKSMDKVDEGVLLIAHKLDTFLKSQGIETIQTETYDEDLHEVISVIPSDEQKVVDVVSKGYSLNGKPFRYPKIVLGK